MTSLRSSKCLKTTVELKFTIQKANACSPWTACCISSNVNEVIRAVLNFFYEKILHAQNAQNVHKRTKTKKSAFYAHKKRLFAYLCFLCFCLDAYLYFLCVQNLFVKKNMKRFQTDDLMTSFTLLLKFILLLT